MFFQLVIPYDHTRNLAERAIETWKSYFIAGLSKMPKTFPLHLWCRLLPFCDINLNKLQSALFNPHISAYETLYGLLDYNAMPLASPGTRAIVYETPNAWGLWDVHGARGCYLSLSLDHYRCHVICHEN